MYNLKKVEVLRFLEILILKRYFISFSVRPSNPVIKISGSQSQVEGYLGPYQIGKALSLTCEVKGGKYFNKSLKLLLLLT